MKLRIGTFNLENLDEVKDSKPSFQTRVNVLRPHIERLNVDILCLQEVHGQETPGKPRDLLALQKLLEGTVYQKYKLATTKLKDGSEVYDKRNLVVMSKFDIDETKQINNEYISEPMYKKVTAEPKENEAKPVEWERPILYTQLKLPKGEILHLINLHLKSRLPTPIPGQKTSRYKWKSSSGWAEGAFISSMKRVGQALETRILIDKIFDKDPNAKIVVCGDFNAHPDEVPVEALIGRIENTGNPDHSNRVLLSCENSIPESARYTYIHQGKKRLLDHMLISQAMLPRYVRSEIHNEMLHDETIAFATETKYPESDHAPFIAEFEFED